MSNSDSNKKQTSKKNNSYSLLLKGLSEQKPQSSGSQKKSKQEANQMSSKGNPSTSAEAVQDPDIPDRSYGDYYCKVCDSHMNSDNMWDAHITGKRHLKNVKKGDQDSKYEDLPDMESSIKHELRNVKDPIVGLSYIHEILRKEPNVPSIYNCFLCHASIATVPLVIEHVISLKHRLNYIKENNTEEYDLLEATNLKKGHMEPLVLEVARKMEQQFGRGTVKVKQEKKKNPVVTYSAKRSFNLNEDYDDGYQKSYKNSRDDNNLWKSVDTEKSFRQWERNRNPRSRSRSPRPRSRSPRPRSRSPRPRSKSPRDLKERKRMLSGDDYSMDGYKRSISNRDFSPPRDYYEKHKHFSKRDASPEQHYPTFRSNVDYSHSLRSDSRDRMDYVSSRYDHINPLETVKKQLDSFDFQKSLSNLAQETFLPSRETFIENPSPPKSKETALEELSQFSTRDRYEISFRILKSLPEVSDISEILFLLQIAAEAQKRLKCCKAVGDFFSVALGAGVQKSDTSSNIIPGLGDAMSSKAQSPVSDPTTFLNNLFSMTKSKSSALPYVLPTSYASAITSQNSSHQATANTYTSAINTQHQAPHGSYQATPNPYASAINSQQTAYQAPHGNYQASANPSYLNQTPLQPPSTNVQFSPGPVQNFQPNISRSTQETPTQLQNYNYSQFPSTSNSSAPKTFYRKY